jgi:hypothetical protein
LAVLRAAAIIGDGGFVTDDECRPMSTPSLLRCALTALLLALSAGCGHHGAPALAPVAGRVNYRGRPLASGTIVFIPDAVRGASGDLACAAIQPDGTYRIKTGNNPGAAPGWHRVTVVAVQNTPVAPGQRPILPFSLLPAKYQDPELSGLRCEVLPAKENTINFNLE